jgi:SAM-dependent methyltransferase
VKLYVRWERSSFKAYWALRSAGYKPEVVRSYGALVVPALVTNDGQIVQEAEQIIAWAHLQSAQATGAAVRASMSGRGLPLADRIARFIDTRLGWLMRAIIRAGSAWAGTLSSGDRTYEIDGFKLAVDTGVAPPVVEFHHELLVGITDGHLIDLGCGSGYLTVFAAKAGVTVTAVDINELAISNTLKNVRSAGVSERVTARVGNVLDEVTGEADYIVINPPWFEHSLGERFRATNNPSLWAALFAQAKAHVAAQGELRIFLPRFRVPEIAARARGEGWQEPEVRLVRRQGARLTRWLKPVPLVLPPMVVATFRRDTPPPAPARAVAADV